MTKYLVISAVVMVPVLTVVVYLIVRKKKSQARAEAMLQLLEAMSRGVDKNNEMLEEGDLGWRPLAKGESSMNLMPLVPGEGKASAAYQLLKSERPQVAELAEKNDSLLGDLREKVNELVRKIEGPTKNQTQNDRQLLRDNPERGQRYRQLLLGKEEVWMLVLQTLINESDVEARGDSDQYRHFWADRGDEYHQLLQDQAGDTWQEVCDLKSEMHDVSNNLEEQIRKMVRYIRAQQRGS